MERIRRGTTGVYQIKCLANGKVYIGSSKDIGHRLSVHRCDLNRNKHSNQFLQRCWNKYGSDCFEITVIEETESLEERETYHIKQLKSDQRRFGFNIQSLPFRGPGLSGDRNGMFGQTHSNEVKQKLSNLAMNRVGPLNPNFGNGDAIRGERNPFYGKRHSDETKKKISESQKRRLGTWKDDLA